MLRLGHKSGDFLFFIWSSWVKVDAFSLSTSPSFYIYMFFYIPHIFLFPSLLYDLLIWPHSLFFCSEWPQQTLTRTFHWHQLPKTIKHAVQRLLDFSHNEPNSAHLTAYCSDCLTFQQQLSSKDCTVTLLTLKYK